MNAYKYLVAAALAASALSGTAQAAQVVQPTTVQNTMLDAGANNSFTIGFSDAMLANPFTELLSFTTDVAGALNLTVNTTGSTPENNTTFTSILLSGTGIGTPVALRQIALDPNDTFALNDFAVGAGTFTLTISGTPGTQNGSLGGNVAFRSVAAAVPEPGTWALMLFGFGAMGYSLRRRRRAGGAHLLQAA